MLVLQARTRTETARAVNWNESCGGTVVLGIVVSMRVYRSTNRIVSREEDTRAPHLTPHYVPVINR
jgi:hypothetical protein